MITKMRKAFMFVVASAMCASLMIIPTFAVEKPTIDTTKTGSLTIHKYDGTKGEEGDGTEINDVSKFGNAMKGIEFSVTRVQDSDKDPASATALTGADAFAETKTTAIDGTTSFTNLKQGVYLVKETKNPSTTGTIKDFLVSIPMVNPTGTAWMYDVHVYPKNEVRTDEPTVDKDFVNGSTDKDDHTAQIGKKFEYAIKVDIPMDIKNAEKFEISDTLDSKLNFYDENFKVILDGNDTTLVAGTDYTVLKPNSNGGGILSVKFTKTGFAKLANVLPTDANGDVTGLAEKKLVIQYTAAINETALNTDSSAEIPNNADLSYTNSLGKDYTTIVPENDRPIVKTGTAKLLKVDADNNTVTLKNAEFKIFASEADAKAYLANPTNDTDSAALNKEGELKDWVVTTASDGTASFTGLAYGDYWIVETKAPTYKDGNIDKSYNLLTAPLKVTVNKALSEISTKVENAKRSDGFDLPLTGGMGTTIFTVVGASMIVGAFVLLKNSKKKESKVSE